MNILLKTIRNIYFQQMIFWIVSFLSLHAIFTIDYNNGWSDILFTLIFHLPLFIIVNLNIIIIQKIIDLKRWGLYSLCVLGLLFFGWLLFRYGFEWLTDVIAPQYYFTLFYTDGELIQLVLSYLTISFLLIMTRNWFRVKERASILEKENHRASINLLKSQINPHFLLNSLNNIYSLSSENPVARNYLMKLSEGLKYVTYETTADLVLLEDELKYLDNYVELEKLRIQEDKDVNFSIDGNAQGYLIPPLLLQPFIENCFKHSSKIDPYIDVSVEIMNDHLLLNAVNKIEKDTRHQGGMGIANVTERLNLIYGNHYSLTTKEKEGIYSINLKLNLEKHGL
jgi:sensor histidine kinase YesM